MSYIYEPTGRAREYAPLALNLFTGCPHGCAYCYARRRWHTTGCEPRPRFDTPQKWRALRGEVLRLADDPRPVLLCFTCDPLPWTGTGDAYRQTEAAVQLLLDGRLRLRLLSKGGVVTPRLLTLMRRSPGRIEFGQTLTYTNVAGVACFEPGAAAFGDRVRALLQARDAGCKTFVSLEPLVDVAGLLLWLSDVEGHGVSAGKYVDRFNVGGPPNYWREAEPVRPGDLAELLRALKGTGAAVGLKRDAWELLRKGGPDCETAADGCEPLWEAPGTALRLT
jgi:hypothetical protein